MLLEHWSGDGRAASFFCWALGLATGRSWCEAAPSPPEEGSQPRYTTTSTLLLAIFLTRAKPMPPKPPNPAKGKWNDGLRRVLEFPHPKPVLDQHLIHSHPERQYKTLKSPPIHPNSSLKQPYNNPKPTLNLPKETLNEP